MIVDVCRYVCLAIVAHCSEELMQLGDVELKYLLLHLPKLDCDQIVFEAYNIRDECNDEA